MINYMNVFLTQKLLKLFNSNANIYLNENRHLLNKVSAHDDALVQGEHDAFDRVHLRVVRLTHEYIDNLRDALGWVVFHSGQKI